MLTPSMPWVACLVSRRSPRPQLPESPTERLVQTARGALRGVPLAPAALDHLRCRVRRPGPASAADAPLENARWFLTHSGK